MAKLAMEGQEARHQLAQMAYTYVKSLGLDTIRWPASHTQKVSIMRQTTPDPAQLELARASLKAIGIQCKTGLLDEFPGSSDPVLMVYHTQPEEAVETLEQKFMEINEYDAQPALGEFTKKIQQRSGVRHYR